MTQTVRSVRAFYDRAAPAYAQRYSDEMGKKPLDRVAIDRFVDRLGGRGAILDLGCGPGEVTAYLHRLGLSVCGVDLSPQMLAEARRLHPGVEFRVGDMLDLESESQTVAGVVAFYAIVHFTLPQVARAFREIHRVLSPGGPFLFTFHVGNETLRQEELLGARGPIEFVFFPRSEIEAALREAGFTTVDVVERDPYPDVEYPSRRAYVSAAGPRGF